MSTIIKNKYIFSGHDTFHCRLFWLKRGFDFMMFGERFQDDSGIYLGVGRNMVNAIRFWLKSFGITDDGENLPDLYLNLLSDDGWDPYLENEGTLWLLHYKLCSTDHSSIYNLIFRELRKVKPEFTKTHFVNYVLELDPSQNQGILNKDFTVFVRTYIDKNENTKEDSLSGLLTELDLLHELGRNQETKEVVYNVENNRAWSLPNEILLYCILNSNHGEKIINFKSFYNDKNGVGNIFALTQEQLENKLHEIALLYPNINYSNEAGIKQLQLKNIIEPLSILKDFYAN